MMKKLVNNFGCRNEVAVHLVDICVEKSSAPYKLMLIT